MKRGIPGKLVMSAALFCWLSGSAAGAEEEGWKGSVNLGLTAVTGNSESSSGNFSAETQYKKAPSEFRASASVTYGSTEGTVSTSKALGTAQYNYLFTDRFSGYVNGGAERDGVADLLWRVTLGPGVGYYFIKRPDVTLNGELGISYFREKLSGLPVDDYYALRVAERGEWNITEAVKLWEMGAYFPTVDDPLDDYLVKAEIGLESAITTHATMRFVIQDSFDKTPAAGRKSNDTTYLATIGYKF
jgi:putative salt-induced outer membrane protein YdiY